MDNQVDVCGNLIDSSYFLTIEIFGDNLVRVDWRNNQPIVDQKTGNYSVNNRNVSDNSKLDNLHIQSLDQRSKNEGADVD